MSEDIEDLVEGTRKRVEEMRRLADETTRLLEGTKKAEAELDVPTAHIQDRQAQEETPP